MPTGVKRAGRASAPAAVNGDPGTGLSDREIVRVAREIIAEVGVDGLTMRRLSNELGVALGATYHHVPTKHDLLVLVGNELYAEVRFPPPDAGDWADRLKAAMISAAEVVSRYPGMAGYLNAYVDDIVPIELNQLTVGVLVDAGFSERSISAVMSALLFYVTGVCSSALTTRESKVYGSIDVQALFEDGLDLLLDGARVRLASDQKAKKAKRPRRARS